MSDTLFHSEIFVDDIRENFFPDNSFVTKSRDYSAYANDAKVHVPQAGAPPKVEKNRSQFPASQTDREDKDLEFEIGVFTVPPMRVGDLRSAELVYYKRKSLLLNAKQALQEAVCEDVLSSWTHNNVEGIATSGAAAGELVHDTATGTRKKVTLGDVLKVKRKMDKDNVPQTGRYLLLDAMMYYQLVGQLTDATLVNFRDGASLQTGVLGSLYGFSVMERSSVLRTNGSGGVVSGSLSATDCAAGLAWQQDCVCRALGEVKVFLNEKDPSYYGDILSLAVRAGGANCRIDGKGVCVLYQGS